MQQEKTKLKDISIKRLFIIKEMEEKPSQSPCCGPRECSPHPEQRHGIEDRCHTIAQLNQGVDSVVFLKGESKKICIDLKKQGESSLSNPSYGSTDFEESSSKDDARAQPLTGIVTTKVRVQNICCGKEADLMKRELQDVKGVESVFVNIVGRVAFIKHNQGELPVPELVTHLNKLHLGVSVMESGRKKGEEDMLSLDKSFIIHICILLLLVPLFIAMVVGKALQASWRQWVAVGVIVIGGTPILVSVALSWRKKQFININILMLVAVIGTIALKEWLEGATVILAFAISEVLQRYSRHKVLKMVAGLVVQTPEVAALAQDGKVVPVEEITIGTKIVVCAGEKIPLDGVVVKGQGAVDESMMTGESIPVMKQKGSSVFGGTILQNGYLQIETTSDSSNSMMTRVTELVAEAQARSSHTEKLMQKFAQYYTPAVLIISLLTVAIPGILYAQKHVTKAQFNVWGHLALVLLLIACPCALLMAAPIVYVSGIGYAAKEGVLIKGGSYLEILSRIQVIAFDKTGTLTEGRFRVAQTDVMGYSGLSREELLRFAAAVEKRSSHPLATAIVSEYSGCITDKIEDFGLDVGLPEVSNFKTREGRGVSGVVEHRMVGVGNLALMEDMNKKIPYRVQTQYTDWVSQGLTVILVAVDSQVELMIGLADLPRESAVSALKQLAERGVHCVILTGDNAGAAALTQSKVGAEEIISEMKPEEKLTWIENRKEGPDNQKTIVAMIGDGVNDGPSLAAADVGIAIGVCGTALAIESAGVALMSDNLTQIPKMMALSQFCRVLVIQNICISVIIKVAVVITAIVVKVDLWVAVVADVFSLLLVICNGLRPLRWDLKFPAMKSVEQDQDEQRALIN